MSNVKYLEEEIVIKKAIDVLLKELGPVEAIRFLNIPRERKLDSIKRHREWQQQLNKDQFFDEIFSE